jgi:hypothetical protein
MKIYSIKMIFNLFHMWFHILWTMFVDHVNILIIFISQMGFFQSIDRDT